MCATSAVTGSTAGARPLDVKGPSSIAQRDLAATAIVLGAFLLIGIGTVLNARPAHTGIALLWGLGCTVSGFIVGFLFGFPRVVADDHLRQLHAPAPQSAASARAQSQPGNGFGHRLAINTNLEQVSDWLTKIIVGVGLVELKDAPAYVARASTYIGEGFGGAVDAAMFNERLAATILVFFGALGVLAGYLLTRMFFSAAFRRADLATVGLKPTEARALAVTPLEREGQKVELPAQAKAASVELARAPQAAVEWSSDALSAWARVQFDNGQYESAVSGYESALGLAPRDARLRYAYAIALKYAGRSEHEFVQQLEEARRLARATSDLALRRQIYASYTFNALYLDPPASFERTRDAAVEYVDNAENLPSGDVLFNLACAYGQQYTHERERGADQRALAETRGKALDALRRAVALEPELVQRAQQLLEGRSPGDPDLLDFSKDPGFRSLARLPVT